MTAYQRVRLAVTGALLTLALTGLSTSGSAQTVKARGVIQARSGATLTLQTQDSTKVVVLLTDSTQVGQSQGVFKARRKEMSMAALVPGLAIEVEGSYDGQNQLVAKSIKFNGDDLKHAQAVQAGMHETQVQAQKNKEQLQKDKQELERQNAALQAQRAELKQQQAQMTAQEKKIADNRAMIDAAIARFGELDDYYILDEVTVYFANGKTTIDPKFKPQLAQLAEKARTIEAYTIEIKGYASSVGSAALNEKLSADRANNVANFLLQQGHISLTHMLAPGAMGESAAVGNDKTADGQAENRKVVVRVLQNKGIAGLKSAPL